MSILLTLFTLHAQSLPETTVKVITLALALDFAKMD
jgi:hypothetical protein